MAKKRYHGSSKRPKKQRSALYSMQAHCLGRELSAHLSSELRKSLGTRAVTVRVGDRTKVMRGGKKGVSGKVTAVNRRKRTVFIEGLTRKKADGTEVQIPVKAANLLLTELEKGDERRLKGAKGVGKVVKGESGKEENAEKPGKRKKKDGNGEPKKKADAKAKETGTKAGEKKKTGTWGTKRK